MLKNYFPIIATYKKIKDHKGLRKVEQGDWFVVKKRVWLNHKSEWLTTIYRGKYHSSNKKEVELRISTGDVYTYMGDNPVQKNTKTMTGIVKEGFHKDTRIFKWVPEFAMSKKDKPLFTEKVLSLIRKYL